jgi:segregation and condensation protein B
MNEFYTRNVLEAALLAAGKPLQIAELGQLFDENTRPKVDDIRATLDALAAEYSNRALEVKETAAGFRIQVRREFASEISRLWPERPARYSRALLETLALIAYRQPITRAEIEAVRGVAVNPNIVKTVIERNWVRIVGHRDVPGRPELLGTTREFLDYFGLRSLDELPPLAELKAMGDYNLQLELPNAGELGVQKGDGEVEGADGAVVAVAGLLTSDVAAAVVGEGGPVGLADGEVVSDAAANADVAGGEVAQGAVADAVADAVGAHDEGTHHAMADANSAASEGAHDSVADAVGAHDEGAYHAVADTNGAAIERAHSAVADAGGAHGESAHHVIADANGAASGSAHDAVADAAGIHDDAEADRTLSAGKTSKHAADSDEADMSDSALSSESSDALDDAADDDADEDELSADGHGSRELVAAPRDIDD